MPSSSKNSNAHISFFESHQLKNAISDTESEGGLSDSYSSDDSGAERQELKFVSWYHEMMRLSMGGLYPCREAVRALLAPSTTETKRVLDLGCGSGLWTIELAEEFPHAEIWGMDHAHNGLTQSFKVPSNCKFMHWDLNKDLSEPSRYRCFFDIVHIRTAAGGFPEVEKVMEDAIKCLKPGGLFILIDSTGGLVAEDKSTVLKMKSKKHKNGSRLQRLLYEMNHFAASMGYGVLSMQSRLEEGLWDYLLLDECQAAQLLVPVGPWVNCSDEKEGKAMREAGTLMQQTLKKASIGHIASLRAAGFDKDVAIQWAEQIASELSDENIKMHLDMRILWGKRRPEAEEPAPPVSVLPQHYGPLDEFISYLEDGDDEVSVFEHERLKIYNTQEEYQKLAEDRRNQFGWDPPYPFIHRRSSHRQKRTHSH